MNSKGDNFEVHVVPTATNPGNCYFCTLGARMRNLSISLPNLWYFIFGICMLGIAFWVRKSVMAIFEFVITIWINEEKLSILLDNIMGNKLLIGWILLPTFASFFKAIRSKIDCKKVDHGDAFEFACFITAFLSLLFVTLIFICPAGPWKVPTSFLFVATFGCISMNSGKFDENNPIIIVCLAIIAFGIIVGIKMVTIIVAIPLIIVSSLTNTMLAIKFAIKLNKDAKK